MNRRLEWLCAGLMFFAAISSWSLTPTAYASVRNHVQLERMVPAGFGGWAVAADQPAPIVSPELSARLARVYEQVLTRTYVDANGQHVMLSIAYTTDQRENAGRQTHRPELCFPAQGFSISQHRIGTLAVAGHAQPVIRMVATLGERIEPLTYWMTLDGQPENSMYKMKLDQIKGGMLSGVIQDGMVFRVSSIDSDPAHAYQVEADFINALFASLRPDARRAFFGVAA